MYSVSAKIVKPPGEKPDEFESTISQVSIEQWLGIIMSNISDFTQLLTLPVVPFLTTRFCSLILFVITVLLRCDMT